MERGGVKITSPTKPPKTSTMTYEENEEMCNQISHLEAKFKGINDKSVTHVQSIKIVIHPPPSVLVASETF